VYTIHEYMLSKFDLLQWALRQGPVSPAHVTMSHRFVFTFFGGDSVACMRSLLAQHFPRFSACKELVSSRM
jgi:hypothetical protein